METGKSAGTVRPPVRIAAAKDEAFCFYYKDNLELLRELGCEILYFSPIHDMALPDGTEGILLSGGYPELYAEELAKNKGKNRLCFFEPQILENKLRSLDILRSLRECIAENYRGFSVAYQPLIETSSGRMMGVEALMRWNGGNLGFVPPIEFIPVMEENGMIETMGLWVLEQAMHACKKMDGSRTGILCQCKCVSFTNTKR